jgi:uncharacterized protein (TIGR02757 family)
LLDGLQVDFHRREYLSSDPLEFVHRYSDPWDQEVVAWVSALLAYGNVKQIRRSLEDLLVRLRKAAPTPSEAIRGMSTAAGRRRVESALDGFVHRFNVGQDLFLLFRVLEGIWKESGSLGAFFVRGVSKGDLTFEAGLDRLADEIWKRALRFAPRARESSFAYLLTAPRDGSCCKRWCMFLRWMARSDELDPGLWGEKGAMRPTFPEGKFLSPRQLVLPLDTHTGRITQYLGLTSRKSLGWKAALEVTAELRECDPIDPVRYDFALCRLGILDLCQRRYRADICVRCQLRPACRFAQAQDPARRAS